jgi:hypothetical protein
VLAVLLEFRLPQPTLLMVEIHLLAASSVSVVVALHGMLVPWLEALEEVEVIPESLTQTSEPTVRRIRVIRAEMPVEVIQATVMQIQMVAAVVVREVLAQMAQAKPLRIQAEVSAWSLLLLERRWNEVVEERADIQLVRAQVRLMAADLEDKGQVALARLPRRQVWMAQEVAAEAEQTSARPLMVVLVAQASWLFGMWRHGLLAARAERSQTTRSTARTGRRISSLM